MDNAGKVRYIITADNSEFLRQLQSADSALNKFSETISEGSAEAGKALNNNLVNRSSQAFNSIQKMAQNSVSAIKEIGSAIGNISWNTFTTGAGLAAGALTSMISGGMTDTNFLEKTQIQMIGLTHSVEQGNKAFAEAVKYYKNNPFDRFTTTNAVKNMIQFGQSVDDVGPLLDKLGKVSLSTGASLDELAYIYSRTIANGKVGLEDIYTLQNRGADIWGAFAKATGKSVEQVRAETAKGGVAIEDFKKAFDYLVDDKAMEMFNNTFARQMDRFKGRLSNFKAYLIGYGTDTQTGLNIYEDGIYRSITRLYKTFADVMDSEVGKKLYASLEKLGKAIAPVFDKIAKMIEPALTALGKGIEFIADNSELLIPILGGALVMFGRLGSAIPGLSQVLGPAVGGFQQLVGVFSKNLSKAPLTTSLIAIAGLSIFKALKSGQLNNALSSIMSSIKKIGSALSPVAKSLLNVFGKLTDIGADVIAGILNGLAKALEVFANVLDKIPTPVLTAIAEGILGIIAASKGLSAIGKIQGAFQGGEGLFASLASLFGGKKSKAASLNDVVSEISGLKASLSNMKVQTQQLTVTAQGVGQQLTKGQQFMKTIRSGLLNLIIAAGAIAAFAVAIAAVGKLIPDDFGSLIPKLFLVGTVVTAMGILSGILSKANIKITSTASLIVSAGAIASLAAAIWATDKLIPNDFGSIIPKLGLMGTVIVAVAGITKLIDMLNIGDVAKGLLAIVGVAADLVLVAAAIKAVDVLIPNEIGNLIPKLAVLGTVVLAMGALATAGGALISMIGPGLLAIAGIAADVAVLGIAIGIANKQIPDDLDKLWPKLGVMAAVIGEFSVLGGAIGAIMATGIGAIIMGSGLATILGIAGAIASIANAIGEIENKVPDNYSKIEKKMEVLKQVIRVVADENFGNFLNNLTNSWSIGSIANVVESYSSIAEDLSKIEQINLNKTQIIKKIDIIKDVVETVSSTQQGSFWDWIGNTVKQWLNTIDTKSASSVVETYSKISEELSKIQDIKLSKTKIKKQITFIKECIDLVASNQEGSVWDAIENTCKQWLNTVDVSSAQSVIETYSKIASTLDGIQNVKLSKSRITKTIKLIRECIDLVASKQSGGIWDAISNTCKQWLNTVDVKSAEDVIKTYQSIADVLMSIQEVELSDKTIKTKIKLITDCIDLVSSKEGTGVWKAMTQTAVEFLNSVKIDNIQRVIDTYKTIADKLKEIQGIEIKREDLVPNVNLIKECIDIVAGQEAGSIWNAINITCGSFIETVRVENASKIIKIYSDITDSLVTISNLKVNKQALESKLTQIKQSLDYVLDLTDNGVIGGFFKAATSNMSAQAAENGGKIVKIYSDITGLLQKIADEAPDNSLTKTITEKIANINTVMNKVLDLKQGGIFAAIGGFFSGKSVSVEDVQELRSIIEQIVLLSKTVGNIKDVSGDFGKIDNIKTLLIKIQDEFPNDWNKMSKPESVLGLAISCGYRISEFTSSLQGIQDIGGQDSEILKSIDNAKLAIDKIKDFPVIEDAENRETSSNVAVTILQGISSISESLAKIPKVEQESLDSIDSIIEAINKVSKINVLDDAESFTSSFNVAKTCFENFGTIAEQVQKIAKIEDEQATNVGRVIGIINKIKLIRLGDIELLKDGISSVLGIVENLIPISQKFSEIAMIDDEKVKIFARLRTMISAISSIRISESLEELNDQMPTLNNLMDNFKLFAEKTILVPNILSSEENNPIISISNIKTVLTKLAGLSLLTLFDFDSLNFLVQGSIKVVESLKVLSENVNLIPLITQESKLNLDLAIQTVHQANIPNIENIDFVAKSIAVKQASKVINELSSYAASINGIPGVDKSQFDIITRLCNTINESISQLSENIKYREGEFIERGKLIASSLYSGFSGYNLENLFKTMASKFPGSLGFYNSQIRVAGRNAGWMAEHGINDAGVPQFFYNVGVNASQGLANGINSRSGVVREAGRRIGELVSKVTGGALRVASPSKVMFGIGEFVTEGLAEGMLSNQKIIEDAAGELAKTIKDPFDQLDDNSLKLAGLSGEQGKTGVNGNRTNTINMTNNMYSQFDVGQMARDIMWNMNRY